MGDVRNKVSPHPFRLADFREVMKDDYCGIDDACKIRDTGDVGFREPSRDREQSPQLWATLRPERP